MNISQAFVEMKRINSEIENLLIKIRYYSCDDLSKLEFEPTADNYLLRGEMSAIAMHLDNASRLIGYLSKEVTQQGTLRLNPTGRYELGDFEYTSGTTIEYMWFDDFDGEEKWSISRIESSNQKYYIVNNADLPLDGLFVRRR